MDSTAKDRTVATIGIDIRKNTFHLVGLDERGSIVLRRKFSRGQVAARLANMKSCLVGMEACVGHRGTRAGDSECAEAIRDLVETVTVFRDTSKPGGVEVEIVGCLTALLGEKAYPNGVGGVWGKMVAEVRSGQSPLNLFQLDL